MNTQATLQKVVLITGCSSGFGFATAIKFARGGYKTFAGIRNLKSEGAKKLAQIAKKEKLPLEIIQLDITNDKGAAAAISYIKKTAKRLDVLVNNAGFGYMGAVEDFTVDELKNQFETNVYGTFRMMRAVAPMMRKQKSGKIINLSSIAGLIAFPTHGVYSASKFALEALTEAFRFEVKPFGIQTVLIEPGAFNTGFQKNRKFTKAYQNNKSPYSTLMHNYFDAVENKMNTSFIQKVMKPEAVVEAIYKVAEAEDPALRTVVGIDSIVYLTVKKMLPGEIWDWLLDKFFSRQTAKFQAGRD